ncbi:hypothetical protein [Nocardia farcinica]|uniref:hypothetical protein n=1 Tax=Nocardia farcinica TaxID=37329 RepID=UPI0024590A07|nr:hypothetical protein [Nocardia farcinica]
MAGPVAPPVAGAGGRPRRTRSGNAMTIGRGERPEDRAADPAAVAGRAVGGCAPTGPAVGG